jgi:rare lipoprotein A
MPFFGLFWVTSWLSCFFSSSQDLLKVPDYFSQTLPAKVLSVVGNPLEKPLPLIIPSKLNLGFWQAESSPVALSALGFQLAGGISELSPSQALPTNQRQPTATKRNFCRPPAEGKDQKNKVAENSSPKPSPDAFWVDVPSAKATKSSIPQKILQAVQNFFQWPGSNEATTKIAPPPVVVIRTSNGVPVGKTSTNKQQSKKGAVKPAQMPAEKAATTEGEQYQVWVKETLVAQLPDEVRAKLMAQRLGELLQEPTVDGNQLQPGLQDGLPALKLGDRLLFVIDDDLTLDPTTNRELLAIEWTNNLRVALNAQPLSLVDAQTKMYNLVETATKIPGLASWYGPYFHGRLTANGERYNQYAFTAAHPSLPFNTYLKVKNLSNGIAVIIRVNDRGPYIPPRNLDLSRQAARCIESESIGVVKFEATVMQLGANGSSLIGQRISQ